MRALRSEVGLSSKVSSRSVESINSVAFAISAAYTICELLAFGSPYRMLSLIGKSKRVGSYMTRPIWRRKSCTL